MRLAPSAPPTARREPARRLAALGNATVVVLLLLLRGSTSTWIVAIAGALRIAGIAWNIMTAPVYTTTEADQSVVDELGLADEPEAVAIAADIEAAESVRGPIDRGWTLAFIATLFAIHMGRMRTELTILGLVSPAVAILGDMTIAVLVTLVVVNPLYLLWRGPTRWVERRVWRRHLEREKAAPHGWRARAARAWLRWRMRSAIRMRAARFSVPAALGQGLRTGLPFAAIVAATVPVWGMKLVLRHRELGRRDVELMGRVADRHVARGHGACGDGYRRERRNRVELRRPASWRHLWRLLLRCHRRSR